MPRPYTIRLHLAGEVYPIYRDVTCEHPRASQALTTQKQVLIKER
jgi:hypothetical protein